MLCREQEYIKKAIKNQITQSLKDECIKELKNPRIEHNSATITDIFTFLNSTCAKITSIDLEDNEKMTIKPHNEEFPFGMIIKQV